MSQLWWNRSILGFFFTEQAIKTLEELMAQAEDCEAALEQIESYANSCDMDADELGDMFHDMTVDELAAEIGVDIVEDDDEEDEDKDEEEVTTEGVLNNLKELEEGE